LIHWNNRYKKRAGFYSWLFFIYDKDIKVIHRTAAYAGQRRSKARLSDIYTGILMESWVIFNIVMTRDSGFYHAGTHKRGKMTWNLEG